MSTTRVSVVLCTHQGAQHLQRQLDTLAAQTHPPAELVVRDDGSTDDTGAIVDRFRASAPFPVQFTRGERIGLARSLATAITCCEGELVALCDQDDEWHPTKLARTVEVLDARPGAAAAVTNGYLIDAEGRRQPGHTFDALGFTRDAQATFATDPVRVLAFRSVVSGHALVVRHRVVRQALPFPAAILADAPAPPGLDGHSPALTDGPGPGMGTVPRPDRWLALVAAGIGSIAVIDEPLVGHRQHAAQATGVDARRHIHATREVRRWIAQLRSGGAGTRQRLTERAELLDEAAGRTGSTALAAAAEHLSRRAALPDNRAARVGAIRAELDDGGYRWSGGARVAVADALRPLG